MISFLKSLFSRLFNVPFHDKLHIQGKVKLVLKDKNGKVKTTRVVNNVTDDGLAAVMDQLLATPTLGKPTHGGVGTGIPAGGDMQTPVAPRVALTSKTALANVLTMVFDLPAGVGTGNLTEAGLYDALTSGNCLATALFSVIPKGAADTLEITWTWTLT